MSAGLPGTGIGGIFYLASALVMPVHRLVRGQTHQGRSWRRALGVSGMAAGILAVIFGTGYLTGVFAPVSALGAVLGPGGTDAATPFLPLGWMLLLITLGVLGTVLVLVEAAALYRRLRRRLQRRTRRRLLRRTQSASPAAPRALGRSRWIGRLRRSGTGGAGRKAA
jgi:hypothetical protein